MLNSKRIIFISLAFLLMLGCKNRKEKLIILKDYYPTGELKSKRYINQDELIVDTAYYYYKNGKDSLVEVRNDSGVLNGNYIFYYDNGNVFQKGTNTDGQKNGISSQYYRNGNLHTINFYMNDKFIGDVFSLQNNGRIEYYTFYDFQERARTYTSWDSTGLIKTNIGKIIFVDSLVIDPEENLFKFLLLISNPPMTRTEVTINYLNKENEILKLDTLVGERFFSTGGKLDGKVGKINVYGIQYDSSGHAVYKDSSYKILNR